MSYQETTSTSNFSVRKRSNHGLSSIEQGAVSHTNDIAGYDLILGVSEGLGS